MSAPPRRLLFGDFELRLDSGELLRASSLVKLQPQPARILEILASRSGEVVSREEIRQLVWGDAAVDFDASLNFCIKEIRRVLGDSATSPTFVETVPRRGYRFLKPVTVEPSEVPIPVPSSPPGPRRRSPLGEIGLVGALVGLLLILTFLVGSRVRPALPRLAVLPLDCRSQDLADQQVCGGITEALNAELVLRTSPDLDVIAPLSALVYNKKKMSEIASGLKATAVLTGEAWPSAQGLRLTMRLARSEDGKELWRESFDAELKDAPLVYRQIARAVARTLELPVAKSPAASHRPSPPAYEAYLRGIYLRRHEQSDKAVASLQDAVLIDPGFAPAFAELALARIDTSSRNQPGIEAIKAAADRALALDANLADAHLALGKLLYLHDLNWREAGRELRMAVALDPGNANAHHEYSVYLAALGRHAEALAAVKRARELDPASMIVGSDYAWYFYLDHRYEEAIREARNVLDLSPLFEGAAPQSAKWAAFYTLDTLLNSAWKLGDRETALGAAKGILQIINRPRFPADRLSSPEEFWRGREVRMQVLLRQGEADPYEQAKNAIHVGEPDRALDLLTRQCAPQGLSLPFAAVEPLFDSLHSDPRWSQVLDCLKLPADAPARQGRS